tara:strand:- start:506073 stop:506357 length:285 start_codon:yes stop_codon:yes gene_type:complete
MKFLENDEITLSLLPAKDDAQAIYNFAVSLESTAIYDSFKEALVGGVLASITDIRLELYFAAKVFEATKVNEHVEVYGLHYDALVQKIKAGEFA